MKYHYDLTKYSQYTTKQPQPVLYGERVGRRGMRAEVKVAVSTTVGIMEVHVRVFSH